MLLNNSHKFRKISNFLKYIFRPYMLLFCLILLACNNTDELPAGILDKTAMKSILIDFHLAQAAEVHNRIVKDSAIYNDAALYHPYIFRKNEIEQEDFERSLNYYFRNPEKMDKMYQEIIEELSELEAKQKILNE